MKLIDPRFDICSQQVSNLSFSDTASVTVYWGASVDAEFEGVDGATAFSHSAQGRTPDAALEALLEDLAASGVEL